jgi:uncharacterized protein (TIGR00290 family)
VKLILSWSSGKDSAWSLHVLRQRPDVEIAGLLTTFNEAFDRVAMHAVRRDLVEKQSEAVGIPLWSVPLPWPCSNEEYEKRLGEFCREAVAQGVEAIAFGDLYLRDVRTYREKQLDGTGLTPVFPLWEIPTGALAREMIGAGVEAKLTCVDPRAVSASFAGRDFDAQLLGDLPQSADPCGENGEFHTFVYNGPMFRHPIPVTLGEIVERDGFVYADLCSSG